jgi:hypothetical protein
VEGAWGTVFAGRGVGIVLLLLLWVKPQVPHLPVYPSGNDSSGQPQGGWRCLCCTVLLLPCVTAGLSAVAAAMTAAVKLVEGRIGDTRGSTRGPAAVGASAGAGDNSAAQPCRTCNGETSCWFWRK